MSDYLVLQIPEDELVLTLVEDAALGDVLLDQIEDEIRDPAIEPGRAAALALTLGRSARVRSAMTLDGLRQRLLGQGNQTEARAVALAIELLQLRPGPAVERAESGYRFTDPKGGQVLYVEDPIGAHWHAKGRWGPPIRPDVERPPIHAHPGADLELLRAAARDGRVLVVTFQTRRLWQPEPPLRITRAGLSRDASLRSLVRFEKIRSLGVVERRGRRHAAFEVRGEPLEVLPGHPSLAIEGLLELLSRLLNDSRS